MKPKGGKGPSVKVAKEFAKADHVRGSAKLPERIANAIHSGKSAKDV